MRTTTNITAILRRVCVTLAMATVIMALAVSVSAQSNLSNIDETPNSAQGDGGTLNFANGLEGTWIITIDSGPGVPLITALHTYNTGGGMTESNSTDQQPPVQFAGHGAWEKIGVNRYAFTLIKFQYDANGNVSGSLKVRSQLRIRGNTFTGQSEVLICDPTFDGCFTVGTSTEYGVRLGVETPEPARRK